MVLRPQTPCNMPEGFCGGFNISVLCNWTIWPPSAQSGTKQTFPPLFSSISLFRFPRDILFFLGNNRSVFSSNELMGDRISFMMACTTLSNILIHDLLPYSIFTHIAISVFTIWIYFVLYLITLMQA